MSKFAGRFLLPDLRCQHFVPNAFNPLDRGVFPMTIRVELNPETEARAKGLPLEKVAEQLLKEALSGPSSSLGQMSVEEFHRMLDAMAEGSERLPDLPTESFSRGGFY
jgi:hypothetical protein